jgi:hypothetical protein
MANASALLLEFMDVPEELEDTFNAWYDEVRLPAHLAVPGVLSARRYLTDVRAPRYLAVFEIDHPVTFHTPEFQALGRSAIGPEGQRFLDAATHYSRRDYALIEPRPDEVPPFPVESRHLLTITATPSAEYEDEYNAFYNTEHFPLLKRLPTYLRCRRYVSLDGEPRYLQIYELSQRQYFRTPEDRASVTETPWAKRMIPAVKSTPTLYDRLR